MIKPPNIGFDVNEITQQIKETSENIPSLEEIIVNVNDPNVRAFMRLYGREQSKNGKVQKRTLLVSIFTLIFAVLTFCFK